VWIIYTLKRERVIAVDEEDDYNGWERWFLIGLDSPYYPSSMVKSGSWAQESDEDEEIESSELSPEELERCFLDRMREEIEQGVEWFCPSCSETYHVKTPFYALFCSECLGELIKGRSVLPPSNFKKGYWMLEE